MVKDETGYMLARVSSAALTCLASCGPCNSTERTRDAMGRGVDVVVVAADASSGARREDGPGSDKGDRCCAVAMV